MKKKMVHVFVIETGDKWLGNPILIGRARTHEDAIEQIRVAGYTIIEECDGGNWDHYDAYDAPSIYGYEPDGLGAFCYTVEPK